MISGAGEGTRVSGGPCSTGETASMLFGKFSRLYGAVTEFKTWDVQQVKISNGEEEWEIKLSKHLFNPQLEAYSRTTRLDDGRWVTVQIRRWVGTLLNQHVAIDVFDGEGKLQAAVRDSDCEGRLAITPQEKGYGKDQIIQGALLAVTGRKYPVVVSDR